MVSYVGILGKVEGWEIWSLGRSETVRFGLGEGGDSTKSSMVRSWKVLD